MKKEDILSQSRSEKNDEYEIKIFRDAQTVGIVVQVVVCVFFLVVNAVVSDIKGLEKGVVSFDYSAILFAYLAGINFYSYVKLKNKNNMVAGIAFAFAFICMLILYYISL